MKFACDFDQSAVDTYRHNIGDHILHAATVKKVTDKASADTDLSTETETIDMGEDDAVTFTNEYMEQFTLPDAGSNTLELLTGAALFALLIGYINRKQHH